MMALMARQPLVKASSVSAAQEMGPVCSQKLAYAKICARLSLLHRGGTSERLRLCLRRCLHQAPDVCNRLPLFARTALHASKAHVLVE